MTYDSREDTLKHIHRVQELMFEVNRNLKDRAGVHDNSKLYDPEKEAYDELGERQRTLTYGSPEYFEQFKAPKMKAAILHHYANNPHHPEYQAIMPDGTVDEEYVSAGLAVSDMSLFDIMEMLMDWKAASERHENGSVPDSLEHNQKRFGLSDQLTSILRNTAKEMGW